MRGTLLNALLVLIGSSIGLGLGSVIPDAAAATALSVVGIVVLVIGIKMAFESKNFVILIVASVFGAVIGVLLGIDQGLDWVADWARSASGGDGSFREGLLTATILFCVGPMTLLGCIQDGLEKKIDLLVIKSVLDLISSTVLASTLGIGVIYSVVAILIIQGGLTLSARALKPIVKNENLIHEATAAGGVIMLVIGLSILGIKVGRENPEVLRADLLLPSLIIAPILAHLFLKEKPETDAQVP